MSENAVKHIIPTYKKNAILMEKDVGFLNTNIRFHY